MSRGLGLKLYFSTSHETSVLIYSLAQETLAWFSLVLYLFYQTYLFISLKFQQP